MFSYTNINPELEKLRIDALKPQDFHTRSSVQDASKFHAAYLFEVEAREILQNLCLLLSSTASGKSYGDWQKFAVHLGLSNEQIKCIDYNFKGLQDPTYYVLLAFVQSGEATTDKIFDALEKINRLDVISRISECFDNFLLNIQRKIPTSNVTSEILQPLVIPRAPLVLSPVSANRSTHPSTESTLPLNSLQHKANQSYGSIVLLNFVDRDFHIAEEIAKVFRSKEPRIGVVILQEQEKHVLSKAEEFVDDCYRQANYIVPILTEGYLARLNDRCNFASDSQSLDTKYLRYIYSLMSNEYMREGCVNNKVRCIVPDEDVSKIVETDLHPTLQAWFRKSDIHVFADKVLLKNF